MTRETTPGFTSVLLASRTAIEIGTWSPKSYTVTQLPFTLDTRPAFALTFGAPALWGSTDDTCPDNAPTVASLPALPTTLGAMALKPGPTEAGKSSAITAPVAVITAV